MAGSPRNPSGELSGDRDGKDVRSVGVCVDEHVDSRFSGFARIVFDFWLLLDDVDVWEDDRRWTAGGAMASVIVRENVDSR